MIAITIMAIGLLALMGLQTTSIKGNLSSKSLNTAIMLAEKKMEELKNTSFPSLTNATINDPNNPLTGTENTGGIFNRSWSIQYYSGLSNMKQITVTINWTTNGQNYSTSLDTVITR